MVETWKPIPGWEGYYEVSDAGNVRSVRRKVLTKAGNWTTINARRMKLQTSDAGYSWFYGTRENRSKRIWVHRAVLEAFIGPRPEGKVCMHLNNDPQDNRIENLKWGTQQENIRQCVQEGRQANMRKTHCPRGHALSDPNLNRNIQRQGRRACQACYRATQDYPLNKHGEAVVKSVSDKNYERIMAN